MKITQNFFNNFLKKNYLFEKNPKIAVAVSGGPDSMCLVNLLSKWIKKTQGSLMVLIIDHKIRESSSNEAKYVKNILANLKIESSIIRVNKNYIAKNTMNEARKNRFMQLINYCKKNKILHLFLGHHFNDNLETYFLRKLAGSNFEGLRSIQDKKFTNNVQILRPLLIFKKNDILNYNYKNNISFVEDPSNQNVQYSRVVVRNFLCNNSKYSIKLQRNFDNIKKNYPLYMKMIFQKFNLITKEINKNNILIENKKFFLLDREIQIKIIEIIYKFLLPNRIHARYSKISLFIKTIRSKKNSNFNLAGMNIEKSANSINFSH